MEQGIREQIIQTFQKHDGEENSTEKGLADVVLGFCRSKKDPNNFIIPPKSVSEAINVYTNRLKEKANDSSQPYFFFFVYEKKIARSSADENIFYPLEKALIITKKISIQRDAESSDLDVQIGRGEKRESFEFWEKLDISLKKFLLRNENYNKYDKKFCESLKEPAKKLYKESCKGYYGKYYECLPIRELSTEETDPSKIYLKVIKIRKNNLLLWGHARSAPRDHPLVSFFLRHWVFGMQLILCLLESFQKVKHKKEEEEQETEEEIEKPKASQKGKEGKKEAPPMKKKAPPDMESQSEEEGAVSSSSCE